MHSTKPQQNNQHFVSLLSNIPSKLFPFLQIILLTGEPTHSASKGMLNIWNQLRNIGARIPFISLFVCKWSIHYASLSAMFNLLHSNMSQELLKKHLSSHYENYAWSIVCPNYCLKVKYPLHFFIQPSTMKNGSKSISVIKAANIKNTDNFHYVKKAIMCYYQTDTFCCQQRWMGHKAGHW